MKRYLYLFLFLFLLQYSCRSPEAPPAENNLDAARNFIRSALDGKFREARDYMLQDSLNMNYMDVAERSYQRADQDTKDGYRSSTIRIYSPVTELNDSITIIIFSNTFKNDKDTLKVIHQNGKWLVDLKYLYLHDNEMLPANSHQTDSLP